MDQVTALSQAFSEVARRFYDQMLPEYQTGYAAYVYQTQLLDRQRRRIKNLERLFARWWQEPSFYLQPLADERTGLLLDLGWSRTSTDSFSIELIGYGVLMGLAQLTPLTNGFDIRLQLFPDWLEDSLAQASYQALEDYVRKNYPKASYLSSSFFISPFNQDFYLKQGYGRKDEGLEHLIKLLND